MASEPLIKIPAPAADICSRFELGKEARQLLRDGMKAADFLAALVAQKKYVDAIHFLAHGLPAREAIWWGCLCMQHAVGDRLSPPDRAAARAAALWVLQPHEANRAAAQAPAAAAPPPSIAGALATAALHTGGNVAPFAPAASVALAIKLASTKTEPVNIASLQRSYIQLGVEIAQGRFMQG
jgi:hypothetical protein